MSVVAALTRLEAVWAVCGISAILLLSVGAFRMLAYRSGETDHTPTMRRVALLALGLGAAALLGFVALTGWFLVTGRRPW